MKKSNLVVLVDKNDRVVGLKDKYATHKIPVSLHRAVSILIFNKVKNKMLITKRALSKLTWGGFWSNAVCTHPYSGESYQKAAERRLFEELGFMTSLKELFYFVYKAKMDGGIWGEHELDHVFEGVYQGRIKPNSEEVSNYKWVKIEDLERDMSEHPDKYTPWFKMILEKLGI